MNTYKHVKAWRQRSKEKLVECCGGKCCRCGYNICYRSLDFHHIDPSTKEYNISDLVKCAKTLDLLVKEIQKCIILCRNCHGELHDGLWKIESIDLPILDLSVLAKIKWDRNKICPNCKKSYMAKYRAQNCCSFKCAGIVKFHKGLRPTKEELSKLVWEFTLIDIAKKYNVSDRCVAKWVKRFEIEKPKIGYWITK